MKHLSHLLALVFAMPSGVSAQAADSAPEGLTSGEWSSIRAAHENGRHAVSRRDDGTHTAHNPGQQWRTEFDGRGFTVTPDSKGWQWGLELAGYGGRTFEAASAETTSHGNKLSYHWDGNLEEWFLNDSRGLEQGWTLKTPVGRSGPDRRDHESAALTLKVRGSLTPRISSNPRSVAFLTSDGNTALTYGGLKAWDAEHKALDVRFAPGADDKSLTILVDDTRAIYPITIDPVAQQAYLKASNTAGSDFFGTSVAVSGDTVVVGARGEDSNASASGAAYVFVRDEAGTWSQQAYLKASNPGANDLFGCAVAISGDTVVVGARGEGSVNGSQSDNSATNAGAAYVFVRDGSGNWSQQAYLKASNISAADNFGGAVSISGDTALIGAYGEASTATGVNGDGSNNGASLSGAAYVFVRGGTVWSEQAYLKASNTEASDQFGYAVSLSGDTAIIGAPNESSASTDVNGNEGDNSASGAGAAYVFTRNGSTWSQQAYLKASNAEGGDNFGYSVAISGGIVVVGAYQEDSSATGVNGNQSDNGALTSGAAYVFERNGTIWNQQAYLKASNTGGGDQFGSSVAISDNLVIVGAHQEDSNATGVDGSQAEGASNSGAAYVYVRRATAWSQLAYLKASNTGANDGFGNPVAISGRLVVAGASGEDSDAVTVNGDGTNNLASGSGAAYVFDISIPAIVTECFKTGTNFTIRFTGEAGVTDWKVKGSSDLFSFPDDKTAESVITETSMGSYEAVVDVSGEPANYYFRIER